MSLRMRLFIVFLLIIFVTLATLSVFIRQNTQREIRNYVFRGGLIGAEDLVNSLEQYFLETGSWNNVQSVVIASGMGQGGKGRQGGPAQGNSPVASGMMHFRLVDTSGQVVYDSQATDLDNQTIRRSEYEQGFPLENNNEIIGYLLPGNGASFSSTNFESELVTRLNRAALNAALISGGVAILLAVVLGYTFLKPIQELTNAANKLGTGDLSQRVPMHGMDELALLAKSFNQMASMLENSETARREMTADIAHELRTPLAVQRANLEAIQDGVYPLEIETLSPIIEQNHHLTRLVDDLRTLALADSGELEMHFRRTDVVALIQSAIRRFEPQAASKNIQLLFKSEVDTFYLRLDPDRIVQIFNNLLQNALRHTPPEGQIFVFLKQINQQLAISVRDTGSGIPQESLLYIFKRFYRVGKSRSRTEGGTGLGLAIAAKIAESHQGVLTGENHPEGGAVFTLLLPLSLPSEVLDQVSDEN